MKYIIVLLFLLPGMESLAEKYTIFLQDTIKGTILEINPNADGFTKIKLPYGSTVKFKITNVNPFKISGTNSVSKESISFEVTAQFSQHLTQLNAAGSQPKAEKEIENNPLDEETSSFENVKNKLNQLTREFSSFSKSKKSKSYEDEVQQKLLKKKIEILEKEIESLKKIQEIKNLRNQLKTKFIDNYNGFVSTLYKLSLYTSVDSYIDSLLQETFILDTTTLKSNLENYMTAINGDETDINLLREKCMKSLDDLSKYYINAKGAYDELAKRVINQKILIDNVDSKDKSVKLKFDSLNIIFVKEKIFEKEYQFLTAQYDTINSNNKRQAIINKINHGVDYYNKVCNAKFEVYTDAQQLNDDKITITPKLVNVKGDILKEYSPVEIKTFGGWKVDVSTGYLLSFRGDENYTNLYNGSGISGVQKNRTDNLKHAIGALFNFYRRTGKDVNFGPSLGVSIPTDGNNIGFYAGVSTLIMEKNRLVITIGLAENRIKLLNTGNLQRDKYAGEFSKKETYKFSNTDFTEIKYDNVYRASFFIGISYNIFTVKKAE